MSGIGDFELGEDGEPESPPPPPEPRSRLPIVVAGVLALVVVIGGVGAWLWSRRPEPPAKPSPPPTAVATPRATPVPTPPPPIAQATDDELRSLLGELSADPAWKTWLASEQLVARFVAVVDNVARGTSPAPHLGALRPEGTFAVMEQDGGTVVDPRSWARYDGVADVVASIDAAEARRLRDLLRPVLETGWRTLGNEESLDSALRRAIDRLGAVPVPPADAGLRRSTRAAGNWEWEDPALEALSPAEKHLLRTGPRNQRRIQAKLREIEEALRP